MQMPQNELTNNEDAVPKLLAIVGISFCMVCVCISGKKTADLRHSTLDFYHLRFGEENIKVGVMLMSITTVAN